MEKKKPEIRFNGFEGEWVTTTLGDIAVRVVSKNEDNSITLPLTISAQYGLISQTEFFNSRIAAKDVRGYYVIKKGEFAYNRSTSDFSPFGAVKRLDGYEAGVLSTLYIVFRLSSEQIQSNYLVNYFSTSNWYQHITESAAEGARNHGLLNITAEDFFKTPIKAPIRTEEQEKIASFLTTLDKLIAKLEAKLDKLRKLKQALLEKMFVNVNGGGYETPEIRFKGYTDKWQVKELREVAKLRRGLTYSPDDICNDRKGIRVLRSSNISEDIFLLSEDDVFVKQSAVNIPYIHNYDILITAANGSSRLVGKHCIVADIQSNSCVPGGFMLCASTDSPFFLQASMSSSWYQTFIATYTLGGNGTIGNLSKTALEKQRFQLPSLSEQEQIGKCFTQIDTHFSKTSTKVTKLRNIKQSLLQKMFA